MLTNWCKALGITRRHLPIAPPACTAWVPKNHPGEVVTRWEPWWLVGWRKSLMTQALCWLISYKQATWRKQYAQSHDSSDLSFYVDPTNFYDKQMVPESHDSIFAYMNCGWKYGSHWSWSGGKSKKKVMDTTSWRIDLTILHQPDFCWGDVGIPPTHQCGANKR